MIAIVLSDEARKILNKLGEAFTEVSEKINEMIGMSEEEYIEMKNPPLMQHTPQIPTKTNFIIPKEIKPNRTYIPIHDIKAKARRNL